MPVGLARPPDSRSCTPDSPTSMLVVVVVVARVLKQGVYKSVYKGFMINFALVLHGYGLIRAIGLVDARHMRSTSKPEFHIS